MAHDQDADDGPPFTHARTDRQSAGRSVDVTPETLYLTRIAVQQTRIDALESTVERQERDLQHVIDRYEHLLTTRDPTGEALTDGGQRTDRSTPTPAPDRTGIVERTVDSLRDRLP